MTLNESVPALGSEPSEPVVRLKRSFVITFAFATFGLWLATLSPLILSLPLKARALDPNPATQGLTLSLLLGVGAFFGIVSNPIFGRISDRTTSRFGMRRPWLLTGAALMVVGSVTLGLSSTVAVAVIGWAIEQVGVNATTAVLLALIPDKVPPHRRGAMSGLVGLTQAVAGIAGVVIVGGLSRTSLVAAIVVPTVIAAVFIVIATVALSDRHLDPADRAPLNLVELARSFWVNPRKYPAFGWAWISRFAIFMAISMVLNYQVFYLTSQLGLSTAAATTAVTAAVGIQTLGILVVSAVFGSVSDRIRRRKPFVLVSALVSAVGLLIIATAPATPSSVGLFLLGVVFVGLGQGTYFAVDLALVTDVLPNREKDAGKDLGVVGLAQLVPQSLAPAIAPLFLIIPVLSVTGLAGQNYTALYVGGVVFAAIAAITVLPIKGVR